MDDNISMEVDGENELEKMRKKRRSDGGKEGKENKRKVRE